MRDLDLTRKVRFTIADIEEQHQQLADAFDVLEQLAAHGSGAEIEQGLKEFYEYAASFFLYHSFVEEMLMYQSHYPSADYRKHAGEHAELIDDIIIRREIGHSREAMMRGGSPAEIARHLSSEFRERVEAHIATTDAPLIEWLGSRGYRS